MWSESELFSGSARFLDPYPWREIMSWFVTCPDMITLTDFHPCRLRSVTTELHTLEIPQTVFTHKLYRPKNKLYQVITILFSHISDRF